MHFATPLVALLSLATTAFATPAGFNRTISKHLDPPGSDCKHYWQMVLSIYRISGIDWKHGISNERLKPKVSKAGKMTDWKYIETWVDGHHYFIAEVNSRLPQLSKLCGLRHQY